MKENTLKESSTQLSELLKDYSYTQRTIQSKKTIKTIKHLVVEDKTGDTLSRVLEIAYKKGQDDKIKKIINEAKTLLEQSLDYIQ